MKSWLTRARADSADSADEPSGADLRAAYERGRRDERARRKRHPLLGLAVGATALVGGAALALAALYGSFQSGGAAMDHQIAAAADKAEPVLRDVAASGLSGG